MDLDSVRELKASLMAQPLPGAKELLELYESTHTEVPPGAPGLAIALGVAPRESGGYSLAVRLHLRALARSGLVDYIVERARGEVDVRYIGVVHKCVAPWQKRKQRPLLLGSSISHTAVQSGSVGAFVRPRGGDGLFILSNNHVLADENAGAAGDDIIQPGNGDRNGTPKLPVATLEAFEPLLRKEVNVVDCAIAKVSAGVGADLNTVTGLGTLRGLGPEKVSEQTPVSKVGRTTAVTRGFVTAFDVDNLSICYDMGFLHFDNQIEIESRDSRPFGDLGDSGSLVVDNGGLAVGLLIAKSTEGGTRGQGLSYANPIHVVLNTLGVDLLY